MLAVTTRLGGFANQSISNLAARSWGNKKNIKKIDRRNTTVVQQK